MDYHRAVARVSEDTVESAPLAAVVLGTFVGIAPIAAVVRVHVVGAAHEVDVVHAVAAAHDHAAALVLEDDVPLSFHDCVSAVVRQLPQQ